MIWRYFTAAGKEKNRSTVTCSRCGIEGHMKNNQKKCRLFREGELKEPNI